MVTDSDVVHEQVAEVGAGPGENQPVTADIHVGALQRHVAVETTLEAELEMVVPTLDGLNKETLSYCCKEYIYYCEAVRLYLHAHSKIGFAVHFQFC